MEMKQKSLQRYFIFYGIRLCLLPILFVLLVFLLDGLLFASGQLNPANQEEKMLFAIQAEVEGSKTIPAHIIPKRVSYVILDKETHKVLGEKDMKEKWIKEAVKTLENGSNGSPYFLWVNQPAYMVMERSDCIVVFRYRINARFSSSTLDSLFPYPSFLIFIFSGICCVCLAIWQSKHIKKLLNRELNKLLEVADHIGKQELDFQSEKNLFQEFEIVNQALGHMQAALKQSLREQIKMEQTKSQMIGALAHDIKIPLTIIEGNAELLLLEMIEEEQKEMIEDIYTASKQMEEYSYQLIEIPTATQSANQQGTSIIKTKVNIHEFIEELKTEFRAYASSLAIKQRQDNGIFEPSPFQTFIDGTVAKDTMIWIDKDMVRRSVLNLLVNSAERSNESENNITLFVEIKDNDVVFQVTDQGGGFSAEALEHGNELFYMDESARSNGHYGIGLNFVNKAAKLHEGTLELSNVLGGACVKLVIPRK